MALAKGCGFEVGWSLADNTPFLRYLDHASLFGLQCDGDNVISRREFTRLASYLHAIAHADVMLSRFPLPCLIPHGGLQGASGRECESWRPNPTHSPGAPSARSPTAQPWARTE